MFESGMEFVRADFHLHTAQDKEFKYSGEANSYINQYVQALVDQNIGIAVITNHNKFDFEEYKNIRKKAAKKDIFILPGVELSIKEGSNGIHTLIIFDPTSWFDNGTNHITTFLTSAFAGIANYENENTRCRYDLAQTISALNEYGKDYFIVFAHVEQRSGILDECGGGLLKSLASQIPDFQDRVLGMQKLRSYSKIEMLDQCLGYRPAFVEGSDPKQISDIGKGEKTYLKIGSFTFSAIKFALQDATNRVFKKPMSVQHGYIDSISFTGGKLDGKVIKFSPALNTLIGIRGSGKSSILETIRYAFNIEPQNDVDYKNGVVKNLIGSGGIIEVSIVDKNGHNYFVRRILNESPSVLDSEKNDLSITPSALLDNLLYFGQKDLSSSADHETELLNRIVGTGMPDTSDTMTEYLHEMEDITRALINSESIPNQIADITVQIKEIEHKTKIYEEKGVSVKLKKQTGFNEDLRQVRLLNTDLKDILQKISQGTTYSMEDFDFNRYESEYNTELINEAKTLLIQFTEKLSTITDQCVPLKNIIDSMELILNKLQKNIDSMQEEFASIKREISDDPNISLDPDTYIKSRESLSEMDERLKKLKESLDSKTVLEDRLRQLIRLRNETLSENFRYLTSEADKINGSQTNLNIRMEFKGNKTRFKNDIKNRFKGTSISEVKYQSIAQTFSDYVDIIADWLLNDGNKLLKILSANEYVKFTDKLKGSYGSLISSTTEDNVEIYYHNKLLRQHSLGQRASALILFIITHDDTDVIIIDQPEDDLDNKVIYDEVLQAIRARKPTIQFIFATHNANIPVLGDAEMIITADYSDEKLTYQSGNVDDPISQDQIINIMEGGKEAFSRRKLIYSSWNGSNEIK